MAKIEELRKYLNGIEDYGSVVSPQTANDANRTYNAMQNVHFRRALSFAYDRASSMAQRVGEELKLNALRNSYTPYNFVSLPEETTVKINGKDVTYPAGTFYGQIMQDQIDADGVKITVYDPEQPNGGDGFDGWYNPENAKAELDEAVKELKKLGVTVDEEHPIYIDLPYYASSEVYTNMANSYKQSVEAALGGLVIMNLCACETADQWYNAGYNTPNGYEANYDIYDLSGWGPDYGDPSTFTKKETPLSTLGYNTDGKVYRIKNAEVGKCMTYTKNTEISMENPYADNASNINNQLWYLLCVWLGLVLYWKYSKWRA